MCSASALGALSDTLPPGGASLNIQSTYCCSETLLAPRVWLKENGSVLSFFEHVCQVLFSYLSPVISFNYFDNSTGQIVTVFTLQMRKLGHRESCSRLPQGGYIARV